jgi:hypothetical protein
MYLLVFHAYINEMHGSRSKIPSKKSRPYIYDVKFLALLGAPYIYIYIYTHTHDISRLRVTHGTIRMWIGRCTPRGEKAPIVKGKEEVSKSNRTQPSTDTLHRRP